MRGFDSRRTSRLVASSNDISLVIDKEGIVQDVGFGDENQAVEQANEWLGKPWLETVTVESRPKIRDLMSVPDSQTPSVWRQVNHPTDTDSDIPMLYRVVTRDADGHLIVVGRDLRAVSELQQQLLDVQHSMERDYARLHQAETRYRMLFTLAAEGVLIVEADSRRVLEANPAAGRVMDREAGKLVGRPFPRGFNDVSEDAIEALLNQVRAAGSADDIIVRLNGSERDLKLGATLLRREDGLFFLVRIAPHGQAEGQTSNQSVLEVIQRAPDSFLVTDPEGKILTCNQAFVELCQLGSDQQAMGQPIDRWVGRAGVDIDLLRKNLRQRTHVKQFSTILRPEFGEPIDVELSAVAALDADPPCLGFVIRHNMRRPAAPSPKPDEPLSYSLQNMTELIGRVPLKELVRETSDIIEQLCIEAALRTTNDNRASAAELLGLSRQSLYVKLRRHGLVDYSPKKED